MRTQYGPMRSHLCQRRSGFGADAVRTYASALSLYFCLSLVRVRESRPSRGSGFHGVGRCSQGGSVRKGVVFENVERLRGSIVGPTNIKTHQ